ncbi:CBS domain-containing protein [uncultured Desulfuromonas sp.]|uniref:CBS domain-containing protein n=1 Tax=uncultured Desulfuromonas sp. TaxID=181013 RepID=UPI002AAA7E01|nr:CBS domain-containing protein [uncultured Desulfuromonas sp.]
MKISEIMQRIRDRDIPCVQARCPISEVVEVAVRFPHSRLVYVTDDYNRLLGAITIGALLRFLYPYHYDDKIHSRDILRRLSVKKAADLMSHGNIKASPEESVDTILKRMAKTGVKELAVVDDEGHILADITVVDLLAHSEPDAL